MAKDLLIVFSNYNGYRTSNNLKEPRILVTIDSFRRQVPDADSWNVLLLDTNSKDGSEKLLQRYVSENWRYHRKKKEDFYLGTLKKLTDKFHRKYKYIMVVDNDHYFFRPGFLETTLSILDNNPDVVNVQLNEMTRADCRDKTGKEKHIAGIYDYVGIANKEIWLRSTQCKRQTKWFHRTSPLRGGGVVRIPRTKLTRRACWLWWASSNTVLRTRTLKEIFKLKSMKMPFRRNQDRLTLFGYYLNKFGRTAWLARGGSINFGFRRNLKQNFNIKGYLKKQSHRKSLFLIDGYSFFVKKHKLKPISTVLEAL